MGDYYAYLLDDDGRVFRRVNITCDDDEEARRITKQMVDRHAIELWQLERRIAIFHPDK